MVDNQNNSTEIGLLLALYLKYNIKSASENVILVYFVFHLFCMVFFSGGGGKKNYLTDWYQSNAEHAATSQERGGGAIVLKGSCPGGHLSKSSQKSNLFNHPVKWHIIHGDMTV